MRCQLFHFTPRRFLASTALFSGQKFCEAWRMWRMLLLAAAIIAVAIFVYVKPRRFERRSGEMPAHKAEIEKTQGCGSVYDPYEVLAWKARRENCDLPEVLEYFRSPDSDHPNIPLQEIMPGSEVRLPGDLDMRRPGEPPQTPDPNRIEKLDLNQRPKTPQRIALAPYTIAEFRRLTIATHGAFDRRPTYVIMTPEQFDELKSRERKLESLGLDTNPSKAAHPSG
jgi:hypothetical protein